MYISICIYICIYIYTHIIILWQFYSEFNRDHEVLDRRYPVEVLVVVLNQEDGASLAAGPASLP